MSRLATFAPAFACQELFRNTRRVPQYHCRESSETGSERNRERWDWCYDGIEEVFMTLAAEIMPTTTTRKMLTSQLLQELPWVSRVTKRSLYIEAVSSSLVRYLEYTRLLLRLLDFLRIIRDHLVTLTATSSWRCSFLAWRPAD